MQDDKKKKLKLTDFIDIEFLQEFQDFFAKTMGVASIAVDEEGPITKPSNFTDFCIKYTRATEEGYRRCNECDIRWGKIAAESGKPIIYHCHSGLTDFAVPIMIGEEHIASILGGQVLTVPPDEEHFRSLARELGIDEDEYIDAVKQIKIVPEATVDAAANFLYLVANAISKIAHKNFELMKKNKRENIYRNIIDTIRTSIDIDEIKQLIVNIVGINLDADRCFITEYDKGSGEFLAVKDEYLSLTDILSMKGIRPDKIFPSFARAYKEGKSLLIKDRKIYLDTENQEFEAERKVLDEYGVNSAFSFPLFYLDELLGVLSIDYVNKEHEITREEIDLITMIGNQVSLAFYQAKLYKLNQLNAERESLLRNIIETIRSSLNVEEILSFICEKTAKLFNVQRLAITFYPDPENYENFIIKKEYKSSPEISGLDQTNNFISKVAAYWGDVLLKNEAVVAFNTIWESDAPTYFKDFYGSMNVKSIIGIAIRKGNDVRGTLVLSAYDNYRSWSDEEKTLLKTVSNQIYIAINQAELYEQEQKQAKREKFGRNIIEILRNAIDKNIIKHLFVMSIAKYFNADRVYFSDFDQKKKMYLPVDKNSEFLSNSEEKSFVGQDWSVDSMKEYIRPLLEKRELKIPCWEDYIKTHPHGQNFISRFEEAKVKSSYNFPVVHEGSIIGYFCIEFTRDGCKGLSDDDIFNIRSICTQAGIALYHSELYTKEKETAERERILRRVISTIRSSLDIEKIKNEMVNQIALLFNANRVCLAYYNHELETYNISENSEYRSSDKTKSFVGVNFNDIPDFMDFIRDAHVAGKDIIFSDLETYLDVNNLRGTGVEDFYNEFGFVSSMALNIEYGKIFLGNLVITFEQKRTFTDDEIKFLRAIADQAGTAFYQAELYEQSRKQAERENLLRTIIGTIRKTLNFIDTKKTIVKEIGKALNANRVVLVEFDMTTNTPGTIDKYSEYLSSEKEVSFIGSDLSSSGMEFFTGIFKQFQLVVVQDVDKYIKDNNLQNSKEEEWLRKVELKSGIGVPIFYGEKIYGVMVIHYTKNKVHFNEEQINFIKTLVDQTGIALYQAELYGKSQKLAEKENLLRIIISTIRKTLNFNDTKKAIVKEIGKALNADRVFLVEFNPETNAPGILDAYSEYLSSEDEVSYVGFDFSSPDVEFLANIHKQSEALIVEDMEQYIIDNNLQHTTAGMWLKETKAKSGIGASIFYGKRVYGVMAIHYVKNKVHFDEQQINFIKTLVDQTGIALYQADLYEKEKETSQREIILRDVISKIRSSLSLKEISYKIVNEVGSFLKADRVTLGYYDEKTQNYITKEEAEYLSSNKIKSFIGVNFSAIKDFKEQIQKLHLENKDIIFDDVNYHLQKNNLIGTGVEDFYKEFGIYSSAAINIYYGNKFWGNLVITFENKRKFSESEIKLLRAIADQAGTAFYQAELFDKEKETANRESLLRNITEKIRSSLDIDETLSFICEESARLFNVQRSAITVFPNPENYEDFIIKKEYTTSPTIQVFGFGGDSSRVAAYWGNNIIKNGKVLAFDSIDESDSPSFFKDIYKSMGVKSIIGTSIKKGEDVWGTLILAEYGNYRRWSDEEKTLLKAISDQIYIAINQVELYDSVKQNAEKETLLREIIENIKLTQNIDNAYNYLVDKLSNTYNADRVVFVENSALEYQKSTIKYEYIKKQGLTPLKNIELPDSVSDMFISLAREADPLIINNSEEMHDYNEFAQQFYADYYLKSFMAIQLSGPSQYIKTPGILVIYSSEIRIWTDKEIELLKSIVFQFSSVIHEIKKIREVAELINNFTLTISKYIQPPLNNRKKTLEFLASQDKKQPIGKFKDMISDTLDSIKISSDLLTKLLDSYSYESGQKKLNLEYCDVEKIINDIKHILTESSKAKSIKINININKNIPKIKIDKIEIKKVIYTLLENAINYTQNNGSVEIKSYRIGKNLITCISDNGPGMSNEMKEQIFQRFAIIVPALEKKISNNLGLHLSKLIVEAHNGEIWCESEVGIGTIFCFLLPIED